MTHDNGFWSWPLDLAARQSDARVLAVVSALVYCLGALLMLVAAFRPVPADLVMTGFALLLGGVAVSFGALGKVLVTRSRQSIH